MLLELTFSFAIATAQASSAVLRDTTQRDTVFDAAAAVAWKQFERLWEPSTGLAKATFDYDKLTTWDIGSVIAGLYSAHILGLISRDEYHARMCRTLETLAEIPIFENAVFNKLYDSRTAAMVGRNGAVSAKGYAWSATDLGRFLLWLAIVARADPVHSELATRIAKRLKYERVVADGYLFGEEVSSSGRKRRFQEGRIGYEQYAARGFALWGQDVEMALEMNTHSAPLTVLGVELLRDTRRLDRLTSEPFVLLGLEVGWTPDEAALARNVLAVQERRYQQTKLVTIASEDAVGIPPHFFYYNCIYCSGRAFVIEVSEPGRRYSIPRWVSTKATFGWHALLPSSYTELALQRVARGRTTIGWSSGVFEGSGGATRSYDINTAAVILEAAAYRKLGRPLLPPKSASATAP
jgi:hypothetical protein